MRKRLKIDQFKPFLQELQKQATLIAPVKTETNEREFMVVQDNTNVALEGFNPLRSPKEFIFPQMEKMFEYHIQKDGKATIKESIQKEPQIILGVRPCDLHAISYMQEFYSSTHEDPYILEKLDSTVIIGWACQDPMNTCFCTSVGDSPVDTKGADIMMAKTDQFYLIEVLTAKGKKVFEAVESLLDESLAEDDEIYPMIRRNTESKIREKVDLLSVKGRIGSVYSSSFWKTYSDTCIACGSCTFNCPTCTCFDTSDSLDTCQDGCRYRTWDTCQNYAFTLHASGHNPRATRLHRLRQRVMHKFHYSVEQLGLFSCTGCGRCTRSCPVRIDMVSIIKDIKEAVDHGEK
ncbi:MAG TPA: 4Fe-4S dicluster domain-containing protein [Caldisericia bacterium]|jgi:ferredoxin|nr:4Fe-4S dicluster domain-containing protein [Caldisericia bacterium]HXK51626.1 4Fe-4S dicluster domain-containing protein [Caldisericia bacterium]